MTRRFRVLALSCLSLLGACHHATPLPVYPNPGFGRAGCYTGRGIAGPPSPQTDTASRPDSAKSGAAWVVLDSLGAREIARGGYRNGVNARIMFTRSDSTIAGGAWWWSPSPDSVLLQEPWIPGADWRLHRVGTDLRGIQTLEHDYGHRLPDGTWSTPPSVWPVWLVRIPCSSVPANSALWN
jgi:hypothetical protein